jgi:hypothetical protein
MRSLISLLALVLAAGCDKEKQSSPIHPASHDTIAEAAPPMPEPPRVVATEATIQKDAGAAPPKQASHHVTGKNFELDLASPGCSVGQECAMTIKLVATGDYHVNKEYPYKFTAKALPDVAFLGKGDATIFTRAAGDYVEQGEKVGTMTVRFKPARHGDAKVAGTFKLSVCSADQCLIEQEAVELAVPVM